MTSAVDLSAAGLGAKDGTDDTRFVSDSPEVSLDERVITAPDALTCCGTEARSNISAVLV
jgi:hypothetical protein